MFLPKYEYVDVYKYIDAGLVGHAGVSRIENYGDVMQMRLCLFSPLPYKISKYQILLLSAWLGLYYRRALLR
jgi:hypothetical protein